jgi:TonB-dependent receptor
VERRAGEISGGDATYGETYTLEWVEQELDVQQVRGEHTFPALMDLGVDWRYASATGSRDAPDRRQYNYSGNDSEDLTFNEVRRQYATLEDQSDAWGMDLALPLAPDSGWPTTVSAGLSRLEKERETTRRRFKLADGFDQSASIVGNPEPLLDEEALTEGGVSYEDTTLGSDYISGSQRQDGHYLMVDTEWLETLRLVGGMRSERVELETRKPRIEGSTPSRVEVDEELSSLAATWFWTENQQLRAAWSETLSVPDLAEIADGYFDDPVSGDRFFGQPEGLRPTTITNYDLRWEWYPAPGESLTLAWFSKDFTDPIETTYKAANIGNPLTFQNAASAEVTGWELGWRKGFGFLGNIFEPVYFAGNLALLDSSITLDPEEAATNTNTERPLQGQADQLLNLELGYEGERHRATLVFNQVGERITEVGTRTRPDVYQQPVPRLSALYRLTVTEGLEMKLSGNNLLDPEVEYTQGGEVKESYTEGREFGLSLSWRWD